VAQALDWERRLHNKPASENLPYVNSARRSVV